MSKSDKTDPLKKPARKPAKTAPAAKTSKKAAAAPPAKKRCQDAGREGRGRPGGEDREDGEAEEGGDQAFRRAEAGAAVRRRVRLGPARLPGVRLPLGRAQRQVRLLHHPDRASRCRFGPIGIGSEPAEVHTVNYKDIAAVVSDTPLEVYDPTRENVLAHERVNETVMREHTVIPMSFGTVFKTREDIVELLRSRLRRLPRRAGQDAGQARVRPQGALGPRDDHPRDREGRRGHPPAEAGDLAPEGLDLLRPHAVRPAGRLAAPGRARSSSSSEIFDAPARRLASPRAPTSRSATR